MRVAAANSIQSCPTLCNPIDSLLPGSPVPGILQARTLEWVAISFSNAWEWKVKGKSLSRVRLLATPWTAAHQAPLSMGFSREESWSGVPLPSPHESGPLYKKGAWCMRDAFHQCNHLYYQKHEFTKPHSYTMPHALLISTKLATSISNLKEWFCRFWKGEILIINSFNVL